MRQCNCSVCFKRGALNFRVAKEDMTLLTPWEGLSLYRWHTHTAEDYFCPVCGILPFRKPSALTPAEIAAGKVPFEGWTVNARCLEGLDVSSLPIIEVDGASL